MKKTRRVFAKDLSEAEQKAFAHEFYLRDDAPDDLQDNPEPWGCPWYSGSPVELRGDTIEEMVDNYIRDYVDEFVGVEDDDREDEG